jgi:hypothetical protein
VNGSQPRSGLEERIRRLEDKEAIRDLLSRYSFAIDLGRIDDFVSLWTDDCIFRTDGGGGLTTFSGREEIRSHLERDLSSLSSVAGRIQHLLLSNLIEVEGDSARATGFQVVTRNTGSGFEVYRTSYRTFEFRRSGRRWRIREAISIESGTPEQDRLIPAELHWLQAEPQN